MVAVAVAKRPVVPVGPIEAQISLSDMFVRAMTLKATIGENRAYVAIEVDLLACAPKLCDQGANQAGGHRQQQMMSDGTAHKSHRVADQPPVIIPITQAGKYYAKVYIRPGRPTPSWRAKADLHSNITATHIQYDLCWA